MTAASAAPTAPTRCVTTIGGASRYGRLGLDGDDIEQGLNSIDQQEHEQVLADVIARKAKSLHEADSYTLRQKLLRHAYSHGFEPELIFRLIPDCED